MAKKNLPADYWRAKSDERREAKKPPLWDSEVKIVDKLAPPEQEFSEWQADTDPFTRHIDRVGIKL